MIISHAHNQIPIYLTHIHCFSGHLNRTCHNIHRILRLLPLLAPMLSHNAQRPFQTLQETTPCMQNHLVLLDQHPWRVQLRMVDEVHLLRIAIIHQMTDDSTDVIETTIMIATTSGASEAGLARDRDRGDSGGRSKERFFGCLDGECKLYVREVGAGSPVSFSCCKQNGGYHSTLSTYSSLHADSMPKPYYCYPRF